MTAAQRYAQGWEAVVDRLTASGVDTVFALPGDDLAFLTAVPETTRLVLCRDQRSATFMAAGYALTAGRPGACVVGRGPAVANTVTGLLEAHTARVPLLLFAEGTGDAQVGTGAFQEFDPLPMVRPVTKWATRVAHPDRLCPVLDRAVATATSGPPGPVFVELPDPVATRPVTRTLRWRDPLPEPPVPADSALAAATSLLRAAHRPVVLVGGGVRGRNHDRVLESLAESLGAALFTTASGRGAVDETHPRSCGVAGLYASGPVAELWQQADLVVALGSRLEETATHGWPHPPVPVVQVTLSAADASADHPGTVVLGDAVAAARAWVCDPAARPGAPDPAWPDRVRQARTRAREHAAAVRTAAADPDRPASAGVAVTAVLDALDRTLPADRIVVHENGLQDMWSYFHPYWTCGAAAGTVVPGEQTSLGFGAAAAVGAACAAGERPVAAVVGDGAFQLLTPELPTLADHGVAVLYVVLHNGGYGWLQANLHALSDADRDGAAPAASRYRFVTPGRSGLRSLAEAYGLAYVPVTTTSALAPALEEAWRACAQGWSAIAEIAVDVADVPPGMAELAGHVPVSGDVADAVPASTRRWCE